jgi:hypothetical protein
MDESENGQSFVTDSDDISNQSHSVDGDSDEDAVGFSSDSEEEE